MINHPVWFWQRGWAALKTAFTKVPLLLGNCLFTLYHVVGYLHEGSCNCSKPHSALYEHWLLILWQDEGWHFTGIQFHIQKTADSWKLKFWFDLPTEKKRLNPIELLSRLSSRRVSQCFCAPRSSYSPCQVPNTEQGSLKAVKRSSQTAS